MLEVRRGSNNKVKLDLKGVVLERKLEGLEVDLTGEAQVVGYLPGFDLKGEAIGQISGKCQSDLKGEIEKERAKPLFLMAVDNNIIIKEYYVV